MGKQILNTDLITPKNKASKIKGLNQLQLAQLRDCLKESTIRVALKSSSKSKQISTAPLFDAPPPLMLF